MNLHKSSSKGAHAYSGRKLNLVYNITVSQSNTIQIYFDMESPILDDALPQGEVVLTHVPYRIVRTQRQIE